ncbi:MAG TPA: alpha/beta hydrolase-fold protein [Myxococcales bacterium]|jgi:enterochelin esterase-like enzyme|nr:alpha/beta hydrolase-fold protein [Myxococcales bacterium]
MAGRFESLGRVQVPGFPAREITVYRPAGHREEVAAPALLVFDGQNAFDDRPGAPGWKLHRAIDALDLAEHAAPLVVAIPHGGATRMEELTPWPIEGRGGRGDAFLDWVAGALVPLVRSRYLLPEGALGAALGGTSWGGLMALHGHFRFPGLFGGALALSPSCWVGEFAIFDDLRRREVPRFSRIYLDCGGLEAEGRMLPPARALAQELYGRGYSQAQLKWVEDPGADHTEHEWARRLPGAVRFMYRR